jgi:hypothetical protein
MMTPSKRQGRSGAYTANRVFKLLGGKRYAVCSECEQPIKPGRHKPGEYEHASGCPKDRSNNVRRK